MNRRNLLPNAARLGAVCAAAAALQACAPALQGAFTMLHIHCSSHTMTWSLCLSPCTVSITSWTLGSRSRLAGAGGGGSGFGFGGWGGGGGGGFGRFLGLAPAWAEEEPAGDEDEEVEYEEVTDDEDAEYKVEEPEEEGVAKASADLPCVFVPFYIFTKF